MANKRNIREYRIWKAMKSRCQSPSFSDSTYQQKNIKVCDRWKNSFENFYNDMGKCPKNYSIDRINNSGDYTPENCKWSSQKEQCSNRGSFNILITYKNETKVLKDWAKHLNIKYGTLHARMFLCGMPFEDAISKDNFKLKKITYKGETKTLKEWSKELNIRYSIIIDRFSRGWSTERIFEQPIRKSPTK
jgi:hypothetical protein